MRQLLGEIHGVLEGIVVYLHPFDEVVPQDSVWLPAIVPAEAALPPNAYPLAAFGALELQRFGAGHKENQNF